MMSSPTRLAAIILMWGLLYLPMLGSLELRGEEGKRVMPAVQMLDRGNYLVPHLGTRPYLNKPPLIIWLVAASFRIFGFRNEWIARLPSAISVLLVALTLVTIGRSTLGVAGSTIAAICWLTGLELVEKGRLIETDAINASLFGLALISWLTFRIRHRLPWLTFTVPWVFLGLGCLAKGPGLLFFFYSILLIVAWRTGRMRELLHPAHWIGIAIVFVMFAAWAVPFFLVLRSQAIGDAWWRELAAILFGEKGRSENWALNFPRGVAFFLPWILLLPFIRLEKIDSVEERETARGLVFGTVVTFVVALLLPGTVPRYVLPLMAPVSWIVGVAVANRAFEWRLTIKRSHIPVSRPFVVWTIAIAIAAEIIVFPIRTAREARTHQVLRPTAAQINAVMPPNAPLYAVDPPYAPYLFYVRAPVRYVSTLDELPADARFALIQSRHFANTQTNVRWNLLKPKLLTRTTFFRSHDTMLFGLTADQTNQ